jgi:hypothetical protein
MRGRCSFSDYIAHFSQKSKLYGGAKTNFSYARAPESQLWLMNTAAIFRERVAGHRKFEKSAARA